MRLRDGVQREHPKPDPPLRSEMLRAAEAGWPTLSHCGFICVSTLWDLKMKSWKFQAPLALCQL
jgi:hypothetical protein